MKHPLWIPSADRIAQVNMTAYMRAVGAEEGLEFSSYDDLYRWSVDQIDNFWASIWHHADILHSRSYSQVRVGDQMPGAKWFVGAQLNFAENLLRFRDEHIALIGVGEDGNVTRLSYLELFNSVAACARGLRRLGVSKGDRAAAVMPNIAETVIAMLATTSIGALWSSCSPDFGAEAILDRFQQITPTVLIAVGSYRYQGKRFETLAKVRQVSRQLPSLKAVVIAGDSQETFHPQDSNELSWFELTSDQRAELRFEQVPVDHPVYIMYSSGTTGAPKCIVHGAGGTLLQHYKELVLHTDLKRQDRILYYTTCGWMMWNWLVSSLMTGATVVLYDGSPFYPDIEALWRIVDREAVSIFGTSPRFLQGCQQAGLIPRKTFKLSALRTILSTGSPLSEDGFRWTYREIKEDMQLSSISGGTDIISCFALGCPILPVYAGEIQCRGLGMKVEAFDESGNSLVNQQGELVCTRPFPSMPVGFWGDNDNQKYQATYFDIFPGVWRHGDYVKITESGGVVVYGRSDATLNPGGVRIGTAEIYNIVESMPEIADSIVVGQRWNGDVKIVLFVVLAEGRTLDDDLKGRVRERIRSHASTRHIPSVIMQITDVPRTVSGKKVEVAVAALVNGDRVTNRSALANPESLDQFVRLFDLKA